jgi:hypothetical protein
MLTEAVYLASSLHTGNSGSTRYGLFNATDGKPSSDSDQITSCEPAFARFISYKRRNVILYNNTYYVQSAS